MKIAKELKKNNEIKLIKSWVIKFICQNLNIGRKMEQRNQVGCNRLCKLFNESITYKQLVKAGCQKSDFFIKQKSFNIFL
jgi:hypothetical protein